MLKNKLMNLSILVLGVYFIVRLINQSQLLWTFPLDFTNDWASWIGQLHFLKECGFHNFCPYWYNGFISFLISAPGWSFFALPFYLLTGNILISTYVSFILLYVIGFVFLYIFGKSQRLSSRDIILFFLLFFGNAIAIGNFIRLGRIVSLFAFVMFIGLAALVFWYRNHEIDKKFLLFIPIYAILLISHQQEIILGSFLVLCLFLVKKNKERILIVFYSFLSFLLAAFWVVPFLFNVGKTNLLNYQQSNLLNWWFSLDNIYLLTNLVAVFIPLGLFLVFYLYMKNSNRKELLFFLPILLLNLLFLLRLVRFIPILEHISPDPFIVFFLFFTIFFLLKIKFKRENLVWGLILILVIGNVAISAIKTPYFIEYTDLEEEVNSMFPFVEGKYFMIGGESITSYSKAHYAYAAVYHNLSSVQGWYDQIASPEYLEVFREIVGIYRGGDCDRFNELLDILEAEEVIFYGYDCSSLNSCGLNEKVSKEKVCLYTT